MLQQPQRAEEAAPTCCGRSLSLRVEDHTPLSRFSAPMLAIGGAHVHVHVRIRNRQLTGATMLLLKTSVTVVTVTEIPSAVSAC